MNNKFVLFCFSEMQAQGDTNFILSFDIMFVSSILTMMIMWLFQYMIYITFVHLSLWWISIVHSCPEKSRTTAQLPNLKITSCVLLTGVAIVGPWAWFRAGLQCLDKVSLKFIPKGPIHNNPALVEIMAWRRIGDKSLSELMLTRFTDVYIWHQE